GDMAELGESSEPAHSEAGEQVAKLGLNGLIAVGQWGDVMVRAAQGAGLANVAAFEDAAHAGKALAMKLTSGDVVLVKGSRSAKLERVLGALREELQP
ncbi:MAG: glutamate ligase domain-containing protein, partial [Limisphaerales bacterium]